MGLNKRKNRHPLRLALPLVESDGTIGGLYKFDDEYLSPNVQYRSYPTPTTTLTIGGRKLVIDRAVSIKLRLLEVEEDYHFWCRKKQHSQRINGGEYHKDFSDVEIGYSFSVPQTHIWFNGYAIHTECFENVTFHSENCVINVTPEHVLAQDSGAGQLIAGLPTNHRAGPVSTAVPLDGEEGMSRSLFAMVVEEGADLPLYAAAVPVRRETDRGYVTDMVPTAEFINDCEREIKLKDSFDVGVGISGVSDPTSFPPTFPHIKPFEHPSLFWSFVYNKLLSERLERDALEQSLRDIALLNRLQQYNREQFIRDHRYQEALDRLAWVFGSSEAIHRAAFPGHNPHDRCNCVMCNRGRGVIGGPAVHRHPIANPNTSITSNQKVSFQSPLNSGSAQEPSQANGGEYMVGEECGIPNCVHYNYKEAANSTVRRNRSVSQSVNTSPMPTSTYNRYGHNANEVEEARKNIIRSCTNSPM